MSLTSSRRSRSSHVLATMFIPGCEASTRRMRSKASRSRVQAKVIRSNCSINACTAGALEASYAKLSSSM